MGYSFEENEVGLVFSVEVDDDGQMTGMLQGKIIFPQDSDLNIESKAIMYDFLTMLSVYPSWGAENEYLVESLRAHRDRLLGFEADDEDNEDGALTASSITLGSA